MLVALQRGMQPLQASVKIAPELSREFLLQHRICPLRKSDDGALVVAVGTGLQSIALADLEKLYGCPVVTELVDDADLDRLIERSTSSRGLELTIVGPADSADAFDDAFADARDLASQPPIIRYVNLLIQDAYEAGASDVHLEASSNGLVTRFRLDGVLTSAPQPPARQELAVISRIKLLAALDIAERRRPQDGRIRWRLGEREVDVRVSTVPTMFGESVVLRLLDKGGRPVELEELGLDHATLVAVDLVARRPNGLFLVTGPTGSGKTTTLYACLSRRDTASEKAITVEDPVEYQLAGVTQVPVNRAADVTFASALRSILRQDPDVIMIGEMRDAETAEIAMQAAMTGHLVFSTLHTNSALGALPRLLDLGVPDYLVAATVEAILAQRLVRRICDQCRTTYEPSPDRVAAIAGRPVGRITLQRGVGCANCRNTGFRGRLGLFELLVMTDELKDALVHGASRSELKAIADATGARPLRMDGWAKVEAGLTTIEEVLRVVQS